MALRFFYRAARRALDLVVLHFRAADDKDVEILVLRHQLAACAAKSTGLGSMTPTAPY